MKELKSTEKVNARIRIPGSKSISHRAAIAAALGKGESHIRNFLRCDDTIYTTEALARL
ncbi:MAG: 3-phosphoshikimate 1-carboxyvinyltransferase, partial [Deltaproteobacteria bacterium]